MQNDAVVTNAELAKPLHNCYSVADRSLQVWFDNVVHIDADYQGPGGISLDHFESRSPSSSYTRSTPQYALCDMGNGTPASTASSNMPVSDSTNTRLAQNDNKSSSL